jgi:predicted CXXCH cytochrome family protein
MPLTMDARIRFFNGRVGCGSCHNLYNSEKNNLAVPSARGNLCRQCHVK